MISVSLLIPVLHNISQVQILFRVKTSIRTYALSNYEWVEPGRAQGDQIKKVHFYAWQWRLVRLTGDINYR